MKKPKKVVDVKIVYDIIGCNKCGKSIEELASAPEMLTVNKTWGYESNMDGHTYEFDICQKCFLELINSFKVYPEVITGEYGI